MHIQTDLWTHIALEDTSQLRIYNLALSSPYLSTRLWLICELQGYQIPDSASQNIPFHMQNILTHRTLQSIAAIESQASVMSTISPGRHTWECCTANKSQDLEEMEDRQVGDDSESSQPEVEAKPRPDTLSMEDTAMEDLHEASSDGHAHVSSPSTKWAEMLSKYTAKIDCHSDAALGDVATRALDTRDLKSSSWHLALCSLKWKTDCGQIQPTWGCLKFLTWKL